MHIFMYICSQVTPAPNNHAANSLSKVNQERNVRNVEVNAEITMVTWIMESVANICAIIGWIVTSGKPKFNNLTIVILCYYVILPYTFLMNTSYNKDRIIDTGWKVVILNIFIKPYKCFVNFFELTHFEPQSFEMQSREAKSSNDTKRSPNKNNKKNTIQESRSKSNLQNSSSSHEGNISIINTKEFYNSKNRVKHYILRI